MALISRMISLFLSYSIISYTWAYSLYAQEASTVPVYADIPSSATIANGVTTKVYNQIIQQEVAASTSPAATRALTLSAPLVAEAATAETTTTSANPTASTSSDTTKVYTTEEIPGAKCTCVVVWTDTTNAQDARLSWSAWPKSGNCNDPKTRKYVCEVGKWLTSFQNMFREITKWVVYIVMLLWVFAIVGAGVMWSWGSDSEEYTKKAKWWVTNILIGLVILFTFRYILGFLAPWIFQ
jgi:Type IV secretion system pilin